VFKKAIVGLPEDSADMHADMYEILAYYLYEECNFGGCEGAKLLGEEEVFNLYAAQILLKKMKIDTLATVSEGAIPSLAQEEVLIEWYFCNNSYEFNEGSPTNKSPGCILMKSVSDKVLQMLKKTEITKILRVFDRLIQEIQK
jgi:hypothetical protein